MKDELRNAIRDLDRLEGWMSQEKGMALAELILEEKPKTVVEIGVFGGRSLIAQGLALRENGDGRAYGIDPWKLDSAIEGDNGPANDAWWRNNINLHEIHRGCMEGIWRHKMDDWCVIIRSNSQDCHELFKDIDILHADGNHSELTSCRDIAIYLPKVRKGGHIWFDDIDWQTTKKAQIMLDAACTKVRQVGTCALYKKTSR